jgi:hypothetical protein
MQKSWVKTVLTAFFDAKGISHLKFVPEKQTVNGKLYKDLIRRLIAGSWYLLHENAPVHSSGVVPEFLPKQGIPILSHPPYSLILCWLTFFYFQN